MAKNTDLETLSLCNFPHPPVSHFLWSNNTLNTWYELFSLLCFQCSLLFCNIVLLCVTVFFLCIVLFIFLALYCACLLCTCCYPNWRFSVIFLSCKTCQGITSKDGAWPALPKLHGKIFWLLCIFRSLYSVYCLCVNVYCTAATGCQHNCS
jgi:hypothetical protein